MLFAIRISIIVLITSVVAPQSNALAETSLDNISETLYFMGFKDNEWILFYKNPGDAHFQSIKTASEPRELYFSPEEKLVYYIDAETRLRQFMQNHASKEIILFTPSGNDSIAQLYWDKASKRLYMVKMPHGKSSEADIVVWDKGVIKPVVRQISSQFEPYVYKQWLYYGSVHCSLDCGHIIQEIWRKNLVSGQAQQLTLLGNISRQPIVDNKGKWVYFSSNKQGYYHIWRQSLSIDKERHAAQQISDGDATDTDPAISSDGRLFFIRHDQGRAFLMRKNVSNFKTSKAIPVALPEGVSEIRNLRINP